MAAIPLILAAPGLILQPWFILFSAIPGAGNFLSPLLTTAVTIFVYGWLGRNDKLGWLWKIFNWFAQPSARIVFITALVLLGGIGIARFYDFPALNEGIPTDILSQSIAEMDLQITETKHYRLSNFIDSQWLWQAKITKSDFDKLVHTLGLTDSNIHQPGDAFRDMPPYWWQPILSDTTQVYATAGFPQKDSGKYGWHALVSWDAESMLMHMWIKEYF